MPSADPAPALRQAPAQRFARRAYASLFAIASLGATVAVAACVPAPFTFEETNAGGGGASSSSASGGGSDSSSSTSSGSASGSATSSSSSSSSSTGTGMNPCGEGSVCVDPIPVGWEKLSFVLVSPEGGPKPSCPLGEMPQKLTADPPTVQHKCEPCSCNVTDAVCSAPEITCWSGDSACAGGAFGSWQAMVNGCMSLSAPPDINLPGSCRLTADTSIVVSKGTCNKSGGFVTNAAGWNTDVHVCNPQLTGSTACGAGGTCQPVSPGEQYCVRKTGNNDCPGGWPNKIEAFTGENDTRACSACGCNEIACTGGSYTVYDSGACDPAFPNVLVDTDSCVNAPDIIDESAMSFLPVLGSVVQGGCFGGSAMGSFTPTGPVTFCCK